MQSFDNLSARRRRPLPRLCPYAESCPGTRSRRRFPGRCQAVQQRRHDQQPFSRHEGAPNPEQNGLAILGAMCLVNDDVLETEPIEGQLLDKAEFETGD